MRRLLNDWRWAVIAVFKNLYMFLITLYRIIKFAFQNFARNVWLSLVTITIIVLTLFSINLLLFLNVLGNEAISQAHNKINIKLYFNSDVTAEEVGAVENWLIGKEEVAEVKFVDRDEGLGKFVQEEEGDSVIKESLEILEGNPLGHSLLVQAVDINEYPEIINLIDNSEYKNLFKDKYLLDYEMFIGKISSMSEQARKISLGISIVFSLIVIMVVLNTIRIAIYTHGEEIGIMKLVGAPNWFIRAPFLVEGLLYAWIATIIITVIMFPVLGFAQPYIGKFFGGSFSLAAYYASNLGSIVFWQLAGASLVNIFASSIAIGKYLRV